jgi:hypothetical protein
MNGCSLKWRRCRNSPYDRSLPGQRSPDGASDSTVRKNDAANAALDGAKRRLDLNQHAAARRGQRRFRGVGVNLGNQRRLVVSFPQETWGVRKEKEPIGAQRGGQFEGELIAVDVNWYAILAQRWRSEYRRVTVIE